MPLPSFFRRKKEPSHFRLREACFARGGAQKRSAKRTEPERSEKLREFGVQEGFELDQRFGISREARRLEFFRPRGDFVGEGGAGVGVVHDVVDGAAPGGPFAQAFDIGLEALVVGS